VRFTLDQPPFAGMTGRGVKVAVLDSGIHASHPHVGHIAGGHSFVEPTDDFVDRIGHGTAVAAAIREKSPGAELLAVRVFDRQLATNIDTLVNAIVWSAEAGAQLINLSLGTANAANAGKLADAVAHAASCGAVVVSAFESNDVTWFPGSLADVVGVVTDSSCDRNEIDVARARRENDLPRISAAPFPRPIPGVPRERNVNGVSFAVANVTGFLARAVEAVGGSAFEAIRKL
jgi:subtilisin family serine protease